MSDRELGSYATRPAGCSICMCPSRCWFPNGHLGALIGIWWKLTEPRRESCVSTEENKRPCNSGSFEKSTPGTTLAGQYATCSVSAKKLSGQRSSTMRPITFKGTSCLLYTSDAADEEDSVDLGGRRI